MVAVAATSQSRNRAASYTSSSHAEFLAGRFAKAGLN
jgi:hypothetical protein